MIPLVKHMVVCCLIFTITGCGSSSAANTAKSAILKANEGSYSQANQALSNNFNKSFSNEAKQLIWDSLTKKGTITTVEVVKETSRGEGATLELKLSYKDGTSIKGEEQMIQEDGTWRFSSLSLATQDTFRKANEALQK